MKRFTIRVYGMLINADNEVLISDERAGDFTFTKFPGGGLEYGEGTLEGLKREFKEECRLDIKIVRHVYTTDFFVKSAFNDRQVIAIYYLVETNKLPQDGFCVSPEQTFRWVPVHQLRLQDFTFETDRMAWRAFMSEKSHGFKF